MTLGCRSTGGRTRRLGPSWEGYPPGRDGILGCLHLAPDSDFRYSDPTPAHSESNNAEGPAVGLLTFRTLGSLSLFDGEGEEYAAVLAQPKRCALLVFLATANGGGAHRRDTLLEMFWPERDEDRGRNALSQSLFFLRSNLPEGAIISRNDNEVGVDPHLICTDVQLFHTAVDENRWAEALDLYGGDFLLGFHVGGAWGFEEWADRERERLREMAAGAAWSLAREQLKRGALVESERTAQRALDLVYTDETPVRSFIEALARAGDRAAALTLFERYSTRLQDKLDLEPSPLLVQVAEDIRKGNLAPFSDPSGESPTTTSPEQVTGAPLGSLPEDPAAGTVDRGVGDLSLEPGSGSAKGEGEGPFPSGSGPRLRTRWVLGLLAVGALVSLGIRFWPQDVREPDEGLVAVAPFQDRTGQAGYENFGARLATGIQSALDRSGIGEVLPYPVVEEALSVSLAGASPLDVLSREAGAGVVVSGDFFQRGDSLYIQAYCLDSRTRGVLHPIEPVVGPAAERGALAAAVQERVAALLAQHFDSVFTIDPRLMPPPTKVGAFQEYRRGYELYKLGGTHMEAIGHFRKAWELDPTYLAPPLRILALSSARPGLRTLYDSTLVALESSRRAMTRYQRHYFDGIRLSAGGQQELAYREFLAMAELGRLEAASGLAEMALLTNHIGKSIEAAGWLETGEGAFLEPYVTFWQGYWSLYTYALHLGGGYEKQLEIAEEWGERFPANRYYPVQSAASAQVGLGRLESLNEILMDWRAERRLEAIWNLADELWVHGHRETARRILEDEVARFSTDSAYIGRFNNQAMVLHRLGRDDEAHALWEAGINLGRPDPWPWGVARIGFSAALTGDSVQAREMERLLMSLPEPREPYTPFLQAKIAAALGEKDRAVRILEAWGRSGTLLFWLNNIHRDFTLRSLLNDYQPFQELLQPKD